MSSLRRARFPIYELVAAVCLLVACAFYLFLSPRSSSWLHTEQAMSGGYQIGRIDLWLDGLQDKQATFSVNVPAPTRFFASGQDRDDNFDVTVANYAIHGSNQGDVNVNVDLSLTDNNTGNSTIYYIFVPGTTTDANFRAGHYREYLDSLFTGYSTATPADCKSAMNAINTAALAQAKGAQVLKGADDVLGYLLVWSEYDSLDFVGSSYISLTCPITLNAHAYQNYNS